MSEPVDTDRPWWEAEEAAGHAQAVVDHVHEIGVPGPDALVIADLLLLSERVVRLVDEVDRLRAERDAALDTLRSIAGQDNCWPANGGWCYGAVTDPELWCPSCAATVRLAAIWLAAGPTQEDR